MMPINAVGSSANWNAPLSDDASDSLHQVGRKLNKARETSVNRLADEQVRATFDEFAGGLFFGEMLKAMRKTVDKPAYFHGGRAEEIFTAQYDQMLVEHMTEASASQFTGPMFDLFTLTRS